MSVSLQEYFAKAQELSAARKSFVTVTLIQPEGHVPQDIGAKVIVTLEGLAWGTVGGGRLEAKAISQSLEFLNATTNENAQNDARLIRYDLKQELNMVCGGIATMFYEISCQPSWNIAVFGAGHVAQATVPLLAGFACQLMCLDPRPEWLERISGQPNLVKVHAPDLPAAVSQVPQDAFYVIMTQGHATDLPVVREILKRGKPRYLGVIGSTPKSRTLRAALAQEGFSEDLIKDIYCPIGLDIGTNSPREIAVSIAAQLLQVRGN